MPQPSGASDRASRAFPCDAAATPARPHQMTDRSDHRNARRCRRESRRWYWHCTSGVRACRRKPPVSHPKNLRTAILPFLALGVLAGGSGTAAAQAQAPSPPYPVYDTGTGFRYILTSSVRLEVKPRDAEVFVDGYSAGHADDFDGVFQRLRLRPGSHEITLYLNG